MSHNVAMSVSQYGSGSFLGLQQLVLQNSGSIDTSGAHAQVHSQGADVDSLNFAPMPQLLMSAQGNSAAAAAAAASQPPLSGAYSAATALDVAAIAATAAAAAAAAAGGVSLQRNGSIDASLARSGSCRGPLETVPEAAAASFVDEMSAAVAGGPGLPVSPAASAAAAAWQQQQQQQQLQELYQQQHTAVLMQQQQQQQQVAMMQQQQHQAYGCGGALCGNVQCSGPAGGCTANLAR
jgi:hypothetical protein